MALLKVTGTTYTLLHLFLMFYSQAQAQNSTATPAASTSTAPASTSAAPSSTTTPPSSTQLVSSSTASGGTTATLSSSSGASLNTASQSSTVPTNATTTSPTLSTIITTSTTTISSSNTLSSLTVSTTLPNTTSSNTTSPSSTLPTQTNTTVSPNVTTTSEHNTTALPNVTMTSEHNTTVSPNVTMTTEHNTTVSPNVTMTSEHNTTVLPNVTMTSEHNTTVSPNVTMTTEQNTTVSPNVTMTSQPNTTDSLNDTVTNSTNVSGTSTSSAANGSASSTTSLSPPATSTSPSPSTSPSSTTTATPTRPPQGSTVVVMLTAVTAGYHPAKVNFTLDNINRWSSGLCDTKTTTSVVALKLTSGSDYFYYVNNITETTGTANSVTFTCMVDDLPNLSTRFYGTITCSRDSQSCTSGNGAGTCASFTMVTNQCSVSFLWPSHQHVSIAYNPNVLSFTCREDKTISCLADIGVSQVTGATSVQPPATPIADNFTSRDGDKGHSGVILGVILSILVVAIALGLGVVWWRQRNSKQRGSVQFHNDGSQPRPSNPVGLRIGEKRTLHRLQSSNSDDTEFEFSSVNLSPTAPSPQATIDVTSGQKLHSKNDSADHNTASGAHHKYATNDQEGGDNSQRVSHVYDLPTDDRKAH